MNKEMATQFSILVWRIPMDRGVWWTMVRRVAKSQTGLKRLSTHARRVKKIQNYLFPLLSHLISMPFFVSNQVKIHEKVSGNERVLVR